MPSIAGIEKANAYMREKNRRRYNEEKARKIANGTYRPPGRPRIDGGAARKKERHLASLHNRLEHYMLALETLPLEQRAKHVNYLLDRVIRLLGAGDLHGYQRGQKQSGLKK